MNTYSSNQVKARDQWTVKRDVDTVSSSIKVFVINVLLLAGAIATAYVITH